LPVPDIHTAHDEDMRLLSETVREAGALALTMFRQRIRNWSKTDGSPVTEADIAVDAFLKSRLLASRPAYGWLSEETPDTSDRLKTRAIWIADPIDGTRSFLERLDDWCVAVALAVEGRPVCGAVYCPVKEEFYEATQGRGARVNGRKIELPDRATLEGAHVAGSSGALKSLARQAAIAAHPRTTVPLALRLCCVARGSFDATVSTGHKSDWDLAAGDLIVHEAGGKVTGTDGRTFLYNGPDPWQKGMVAASPSLHATIISTLGT
jgi:myo-inositol-1(or 4)-monophosphatase